MPIPLTRILVTIISLLIIFCFSYISLASLTTPSSTRSAHNFLFPSTTVISLSDDNSTCFISRPAAFGPSIPKSGLKGELFVLEEGQLACDDTPEWDPSAATPPSVANQEDGTDDMNYASSASNKEKSKSQHADIESLQQSAEIEGKIVLVTRGGCGFLEKVLWAQRRGAVALIVGDYKKSGTGLGNSGLVTMYANGDTSNVTIPSVFTTHTTARLLTSLLPKYLTSLHHSMPATEPPIPAPRAPAQPASKEEGKSRIKWLFPGNTDSEPHESGMALLSPTSTSSRATIETSTSIQKAATTPTMIAGSLPEWKGVQVDSSHRPPMSGELEGIVFVVKSEEMKKDDTVVEGENEREGLWITLTPMSMSTSPLFDTLLVLVISPLVTLTVVYALLLIRSMIRRRRWRAPKSVVDRLPVRTYQSTSTATSPVITHPSSSSSSAPPSLPETPSSQPSLHPPRSSSLPTVTAASPNRSVEKNNSRDEVPRRSRYMGGSVECVVCLEEYVDGVSRVMRLPCGHEFHASCITPWLTTRRRTCPICKGDVVRGTAAGSSSGSGWTRHSDAGEVSERTPLVAEDEGLEN
ncbi:uncharacterized protein H6S33_002408 [Morchella sextelata]|uniref:uncharacterized protein n=1 Tax=Morchella sextelata TaxID=1174677 RepID=UPI001D05C21A|nr:uncharacterized protein H6S33_002408 [Morchella sextelata]KAH0607374.1 hypothetical protein H6S33_002408 [Morchella sextelata]